jgi:hypothetical protein
LLLLAQRPDAFATFTVIGAVSPRFVSDSPPRPVLYLFGRREDPAHKDDWAKTVEALVRHNRTSGPLSDSLGCCKRHAPGPGGAPLVFGLYNAGHIWPFEGNKWLMEFARADHLSGQEPNPVNVSPASEPVSSGSSR